MTKDEALRLAWDALQQIAHVSAMDYEYQQWAVEAITAIKEALAQPEQCRHRIADARNKVVKDGYICVDCGALFSAADHNEAQREQDGECKYCTDGCPACDARKLKEKNT
jgi:DNA-directed RNA polymerase subunit RPC12/RpoP